MSPLTKQIIDELGVYLYSNNSSPEDQDTVYLGPYQLESGAIYDGQWKHGVRHGKGKQVWRDGSVYEGFWMHNQAHG